MQHNTSVASELSRKIFTCAFVLVVACSRFDVKSHEGHPSSGSDSNVTAAVETPHCKAKASRTDSICKPATDLHGAKVIPLHDLRAEGRGGGIFSETDLLPAR